jgi:hypothetical protein
MRSDRLLGRQTPAWRTGEEAAPAVLQSAFSSVRQADGYGLHKPGCAVTTRSTTAQPNQLRALTYLLTRSRLYGPGSGERVGELGVDCRKRTANRVGNGFHLPTTPPARR